jgi:hypothetical protein
MRGKQSPPSRQWRSRLLGSALSVAVNLVVFAALLWPHAANPPPRETEPAPLMLSLAPIPRPPAPRGAATALPHMVQPPQPLQVAMPRVIFASTSVPDTSDLLSESQLAGAAGTGGGSGGGSCDIAQLLQQSLRRDPLVRAAVEDAHRSGKAMMLWNGDWVRSGGQDGKGLSAVREAIMWEVAFAPEACRNQRVHGLVLLSLADGGTRFAIGAGEWRWADLLYARGAVR